jgi:hypothetical protein
MERLRMKKRGRRKEGNTKKNIGKGHMGKRGRK